MYVKLILILCFLFIPNFIYREVISSKSDLMIRERNYKKHGREASVLILGNSHLMRLFSEDQTNEVCNFATPGQDYVQAYYLLKYLINEPGRSFNTVVLPLSVESLARSVYSDSGHAYFWGKYFDYLDLAQNSENKFRFYEFLQGKCFAYMGRLDKVLSYIKGKDVHEAELAFANKARKSFDQQPIERQNKMINSRFKKLFASNDLVIPELEKYFYRTIDLCKQHQIKVVLVRVPITDRLNQKVNNELNVAEFNQAVKRIEEKYPNIPYLNYQSLAAGHDFWFRDADHLNPYGAQQLTKIMTPELQKTSSRI